MPGVGHSAAPRLEFRILGPLEVWCEGQELRIGGHRPRALLGLLLLHANEVVSSDRLVELLFGADAGDVSLNTLQATVSRLRRLLGNGGPGDQSPVVTTGHGYELRVEPDQLDVARFERLLAEGRRALADGDAAIAAAKLAEGLSLWRGQALADLSMLDFAQPGIRRLEEMRLAALSDRIQADLALGKGAELVAELEGLVLANPLQERLRGQLMLALYRAGRQADALEAYRQTRELLNRELGLEPSRTLQQLERSILLQDPDLEPGRQVQAPAASEPSGVQLCPFKGLAHFDIADADYFFGRERLVSDLVSRVVDSPLVGVVGPSGSGKSSILRAGLLAVVAAGGLPGSDGWRVLVLRPGEHPSVQLKRLLGCESVLEAAARLRDGQRLVLAVDQFEEVFSVCQDRAERTEFVESLTAAALDPDRRLVVAVSLRGDYYGRCVEYPRFADLLSRNHLLVGAMERDELARAVELPAKRAGLEVEPPLVEALVADILHEPGGLPLLSATLLELWALRRGNVLQLESYRRSGGVKGAVARLAEDAYCRLSEQDQGVARKIMLRLATGDDAGIVRRRPPLSEFDRISGADRVLAELVRARLLTVSEGEVEVSHEALLREWPRFTAWLQESRDERRLHAHLTSSAHEWTARDRDPAELYRGARLASALDWSASHGDELDELEREFIAASRAEGERELRRQRRQNRRLRTLLAGLAALLALALIAGVLALFARASANHSATVALADGLGAQAIADPNLDRAMLLGVEGVRLNSSERTQSDLLTALLRAPAATRTYHGDGLRLNSIALSPDGRTLALEDNVPNIFFLDAATGRRVGDIPSARLAGPPSVLGYAPDGTLVTFGGANPPNQVDLIEPSSGRVARRLSLPASVRAAILPAGIFASPNFGGGDFAFADRGRRLAVDVAGYVVQWALPQGRLVAAPIAVPGSEGLVFYTSGGRQLVVVGGKRTSVLDARAGRLVRSYPVGGTVAALSPDGRTMVFGDDAGSVRFLELPHGSVAQSVSAHAGGVQAVGFTPDSRMAITSGGDGSSRVWNVGTHQVERTFAGHAGAISAQAISADGSTLYTGSVDGTALAWDLSGKRGFAKTFRAANSDPRAGAWNVALSPDGRVLAVGDTSGTVNLWDMHSLRLIQSFRAVPGLVAALSFGRDGRSLLVAGDSNTHPTRGFLRIWGIRSAPRLLHELRGLSRYTWATFSPDGSTVAATGAPQDQAAGPELGGRGDGLVAEWNAATGKLVKEPTLLRGGGEAIDVAFAARGTTVAVAQVGNMAAVVDPAHQKVLAHWKDSSAEFTLGAAFAPNGRRVATVDTDGYLRVWNASGKQVLPAIQASQANATSVNWSPDGIRLLVAGADGTVRLYDATSGEPVGTPLSISRPVSPYATFSPDGRTIAATDATGRVWLYPGTVDGWEAYACRLANRNLTHAEWAKYVPGHAYRQVCSGPAAH